MKKIVLLASAIAFSTGSAAWANNGNGNGNGNTATPVSTSSADTVTTTTTDASDNSVQYLDSFDDNSRIGSVTNSSADVFNGAAIVADATLSNVVAGVDVDYGNVTLSGRLFNNLTNNGNAFQNYAGINALNQNTGVGASQNANVSLAVSADSFAVN